MAVNVIIALLLVHWFADFVIQSNWMATNKAHKVRALLLHTFTYGLCFVPFGATFALVNMVSHGLVDAVTSRITSYLYHHEKRHEFFVVIGLDQVIHYVIMGALYLKLT